MGDDSEIMHVREFDILSKVVPRGLYARSDISCFER